jgi:hypothetical protein
LDSLITWRCARLLPEKCPIGSITNTSSGNRYYTCQIKKVCSIIAFLSWIAAS